MKYFEQKIDNTEIREVLDNLYKTSNKIDNLEDDIVNIDFMENPDEFKPEEIKEKLQKEFQDNIFLLIDFDYLVERIPSELADKIGEKYPKIIDEVACNLIFESL